MSKDFVDNGWSPQRYGCDFLRRNRSAFWYVKTTFYTIAAWSARLNGVQRLYTGTIQSCVFEVLAKRVCHKLRKCNAY